MGTDFVDGLIEHVYYRARGQVGPVDVRTLLQTFPACFASLNCYLTPKTGAQAVRWFRSCVRIQYKTAAVRISVVERVISLIISIQLRRDQCSWMRAFKALLLK